MARLVALVAVVLLSAAPAARPLSPVATFPLPHGELHGWTYCAAKSWVAASVGKTVVLAKLDLDKKKLDVLDTLPFESWEMEFSRGCSVLVVPEQTGEGNQRVNTASLYSTAGDKLTPIGPLDTYRYPISSMALSDDGRWLAVTVNSGQLILYRLDAKGPVKTFEAEPLKNGDLYLRVTWGPNATLLAGAYKGGVRLFTLDAATGKLGAPDDLMAPTKASREAGSVDLKSGAIEMPGGARVFGVAFGRDVPRAWAVVESGEVFAWNLQPERNRLTVVKGFDGANGFALSPDGSLLAASGNFTAQVWKLDGATASAPRLLDGLDHADQYVSVENLQFAGKQLLVGTGGLSQAKLLLYAP